MQKFENGQEVLVDIGMNHFDWVVSEYYSYDGKSKMHIVWVDGEISAISDDNIRPVQLICDEAKEAIMEFAELKKPMMFYVESDKQLSELCDFMEGVGIVPEKQYNRGTRLVSWRDGYQCLNQLDHRVAGHCKELGFNELNLKTGEVIPVEKKEVKDKSLNSYRDVVDDLVRINAGLEIELEEKSAEIKDLKQVNELATECLIKRDERIREQDAETKKLQGKLNFHIDKCREQDKILTSIYELVE